jgi:hypothetical protein
MGKLILMYHTANYLNDKHIENVKVIQKKYKVLQKQNYLELIEK